METQPPSRALHAYALFAAFSTLCLIGLGGLVTSHGVGMAVPDWPNTYGYNMFLFPVSQWIGGIFYEHTHRLLASFVGLLVAILAVWLWVRETADRVRWSGVAAVVAAVILLGVRQMPVYLALAGAALGTIVLGLVMASRTGWSLRWLGMTAFAAVVLQGVLGGLRVVWAADELGIFHATLAQMFLVLLGVIALRTSRVWPGLAPVRRAEGEGRSLNGVLWATTLLILLQLGLGATMRHQHAGLAVPDFPLAYGRVWPDMSADAVARYNQQRVETVALNRITPTQIALHMVHRVVAVAIVALVCFCAWKIRTLLPAGHDMRRMAGFWVALIGLQFGLGAWTLWSNKAADVASMHVVCGALTLLTGGLLCVLAARVVPRHASASVPSDAPFGVRLGGREPAALAK